MLNFSSENSLPGPGGGRATPCTTLLPHPPGHLNGATLAATWGHLVLRWGNKFLHNSYSPPSTKPRPLEFSLCTRAKLCPLHRMPRQNPFFCMCLHIVPLPRCLLQSPQQKQHSHHPLSLSCHYLPTDYILSEQEERG